MYLALPMSMLLFKAWTIPGKLGGIENKSAPNAARLKPWKYLYKEKSRERGRSGGRRDLRSEDTHWYRPEKSYRSGTEYLPFLTRKKSAARIAAMGERTTAGPETVSGGLRTVRAHGLTRVGSHEGDE